jgi:hypothetical protein
MYVSVNLFICRFRYIGDQLSTDKRTKAKDHQHAFAINCWLADYTKDIFFIRTI